jgi:SET domain-containing protein
MSKRPFRIGRARTGLGLFATEVIPKGKRIFEYSGKVITNAEADAMPGKPRYLYNLNKTHTLDGSPRSNIGRYSNHSCDPNAEIYSHHGRIYVKSIQAIQPGEEITYDYGKEYFDAFIGKENCLCPKCVARRERKTSTRPTRAAASAVRVERKSKR